MGFQFGDFLRAESESARLFFFVVLKSDFLRRPSEGQVERCDILAKRRSGTDDASFAQGEVGGDADPRTNPAIVLDDDLSVSLIAQDDIGAEDRIVF